MNWGSRLQRAFRSRGAAAFLAAAVAIGLFVGVAASLLVLLIATISEGSDAVRRDIGDAILLVLVPIGVVTSWLIARRFGSEIESGGVTETMEGLSVHGGYLSGRTIAGKLGATAATLGTGGSGGREGPIVLIGATIGSTLARHTRFGEDQVRSLIAAGAGAAIGASFAAPIAGMLFAMEVLLGNLAVRHLNAVVVASVAAAVTTRALVGEERILTSPAHALNDPAELILYVLLGLVIVVFAYAFLRMLAVIDLRRFLAGRPGWLRPVGAGLAVALIGFVDTDALGTGQEFVADLLRLAPGADAVWWSLLLVAVLKMLTNVLTRSGGGSGGTFMPSLFVGASVGAAFATVIGPIWGFSNLQPGAFAVVGMAAAFAAVARAPLTSILMVFEITGDYGLVLPLMLATTVATLVADRVHPVDAYRLPLVRRGIHLTGREDIDLLDTVTVGDVMRWPGTLLTPAMAVTEADEILEREHHHGLPVLEGPDLVGIITVSDIARAGGKTLRASVSEVMTPDPITVVPTLPVSTALARMAALGVGRLPVVADDDPGRFVGMFRRESVVRAYHLALGAATGRSLYRERLRLRTHPGADFFELPVPIDSAAHGTPVRDIPWPEGATLVSIRRASRVIIPHGDTILSTGDTITAFGTGQSRVELAYLLEPAADIEPELPVEPG